MTPYYSRDGITLFNADCRDLLATLDPGSVDITVSSPPYNMIPKTTPSGLYAESRHKLNSGYASHLDNMDSDDYESWMRDVFGECMNISMGLVWVNHKTKFEDKKARHPVRFLPWEIHGEIIWDRGGSLTLNANRYAPSHEVILGFGVPHYWNRDNDTLMTVWRIAPERGIDGHPCPFPVEIPKRCIGSSCPEHGIVLDPFAGSVTTGVAAWNLGRKAILCEISEEYCELGAKRLDRVISQGRLFKPAELTAVQGELFGGEA